MKLYLDTKGLSKPNKLTKVNH